MNKTIITLSLTLLGVTVYPVFAQEVSESVVSQTQNTSTDLTALTEQAKVAVKALGGNLKSKLEAALKDGAPENAIDICQITAPELNKAVSAEHGMSVNRVSLKNRNPVSGQANEWQTKVLQDFETRKVNGENPDTLVYSEVVNNEFRFMKSIPTATVCLNCHGTQLNSSVKGSLAKRYPHDKATGYKEGDLRGAFVVVKNLKP